MAPQRRNSAGAGSISSVTRSIKTETNRLLSMDPPSGFTAGLAEATAQAPTLGEVRRGSFGHGGWVEPGQVDRQRNTSVGSTDGGGDGTSRPYRHPSSGYSGGAGRRMPRRPSTGMASPIEDPVREEGDLHTDGSAESKQAANMETARKNNETMDLGDGTTFSQAPAIATKQANSSVNEKSSDESSDPESRPDLERQNTSGYIPPPIIPWTTTTLIFLKAFWKWFCTPLGFLITIYGLNVVAWGGMLFLILLGYGAAPAMCSKNTAANHYDGCNDIHSPRKIWLEIDSQILNGLFCVTGFGLIPWRFRDWYYLLQWRLCNEKKKGRQAKMYGLRMLAGIHRGWFRLPGSDTLDELSTADYERSIDLIKPSTITSSSPLSAPAPEEAVGLVALPENDERIPLPLTKKPDDPLTGVRAPPTPIWKLEFFIWAQVINTFYQCALCGCMWGLNRYKRPSWVTGFLIAGACVIVMIAGVVQLLEGKKVKRVEGVPVQVEEKLEDAEREMGIPLEEKSVRSVERAREERQMSVDGTVSVVVGDKGKGVAA